MYRMVRNTPLSTGQKKGEIIKDGELKPEIIQRFLASGTLTRVETPPLTELPEFEDRAATLAKAEVVTIQDLAEANVTGLAKSLGKSTRSIKQWQDEALAWLSPPSQDESG